jgi:dihydroneopterin aldolase
VSVEFDVAPKDESPQAEPVIRDADIFEIARNVITETKYRSITNLAGKIARDMMSKYQKLAKAEVAVTRKQLFIPGFIDCSIEKVLLCREDM